MNLKKFLGYAASFTILGAAVIACNGAGSTRSNPNTAYGQLVSGGTAESNPALAGYLAAIRPQVLVREALIQYLWQH
jgi:hypothetical protein